ncbi:MAG: sodium-translocating pyrophosphatase [Anaerolineae bacterium]
MTVSLIAFVFPIAGLLGLLLTLYLARVTMSKEPGTPEIVKFSAFIQEGAATFLRREYRIMAIVAVFFAAFLVLTLNVYMMITFVIGAGTSVLAGYLGMTIATRANGRTTFAARNGPTHALDVAFTGGAVLGMAAISLGILGVSSVYLFFSLLRLVPNPLTVLTGYSIGASFAAIFARIGGGIYTKAADVGADLVGKVEVGIPEDDPRNPAVIADNVGDNVGDVAGMGADTYQAYVDTSIAALILGASATSVLGTPLGEKGILLPLWILLAGMVGSVLAIVAVKLLTRTGKVGPEMLLRLGMIISGLVTLLGILLLSIFYLGDLRAFYAASSGLVSGVVIGLITDYFTSGRPVDAIARSGESGAATLLITGLAVGMQSATLPMLILGLSMVAAFRAWGIYGIALSGVGLLSILGITLTMDAYGPIADNAGGIAQMTRQHPSIRRITDRLDAAGNTTAAIAKAFAVSATAAAALSLLTAYSEATQVRSLDIRDARVMAGLLIGGAFPALVSSMTLKAVGRTAGLIVTEVRRQFKEIVGLREGKVPPDYQRCIDIATKGALQQLVAPCLIAVAAPFVLVLSLGCEALAGFLGGNIVSGIFLAIFMANAGGAWDNAKKRIETGLYGGKGSLAHLASVVGDTVGDPLKDTAGPTLNILVELVAAVSLAFVPLFLRLVH